MFKNVKYLFLNTTLCLESLLYPPYHSHRAQPVTFFPTLLLTRGMWHMQIPTRHVEGILTLLLLRSAAPGLLSLLVVVAPLRRRYVVCVYVCVCVGFRVYFMCKLFVLPTSSLSVPMSLSVSLCPLHAFILTFHT